MNKSNIPKSLNNVLKSLVNVVKESYKLSPVLIVFLAIIIYVITKITISSVDLIKGCVLLIVLIVSIIVYIKNNNFGEAALALVAGMLTAYSPTWTVKKFIAFVTVWSGFLFISLIISSLKIAAKKESLYKQAAIQIGSLEEIEKNEKKLEEISQNKKIQYLSPIEKAETLLLFSYRRIPIEMMGDALKAVDLLLVITQLDIKNISLFISDVYKIFNITNQNISIDFIYEGIKISPCPPIDFIKAFDNSRHLVLSQKISLTDFFRELQEALEKGIAPNDVCKYISTKKDGV